MREKVGKSRFTVFFQWFVAPGGRKVGSLKRRVRSHLARAEMKSCTPLWREAPLEVKYTKHPIVGPLLEVAMSKKCTPLWRETHFQVKCTRHTSFGPLLLVVEMSKKCTPLWREAHFQVKMYKTHQLRTTFTSWDVGKVHAVVARSTFPSQNVQNTTCSRHFWRFGCWKSVRRCGAKHISKSKCTKHHMFAPLLEVRMLKKCTPLWREAHFEVKTQKTHQRWTTFGSWDVEKVHAVAASKCTKQGFGPLLEVQMSLRFKTLHYRTLHYTTLQYTTLHYITLQYAPLH